MRFAKAKAAMHHETYVAQNYQGAQFEIAQDVQINAHSMLQIQSPQAAGLIAVCSIGTSQIADHWFLYLKNNLNYL